MKQWYALYTKPNAEHRVQAALQRRNIETFLPEIAPPPSANIQRKLPFFPNYLFMRIDLQSTPASRWIWTPGLRYVVSSDEKPIVIPIQAIELIKNQLAAYDVDRKTNRLGFKHGDKVRMNKGPFADMIAIFEKPSSAATRVRVLLNFLGRMSLIQVDVADIEKAPPEAVVEEPTRHRRTRGHGRHIKR